VTYVIAEPCVGEKNTSCIEVCPVDCIHPMPDEPGFEQAEMLHIDPTECIDCGACAEACPVEACFADEELPAEWASYGPRNADYFARGS
jgi:NAD-dependent dihydropyrimidine dehydrogenase PreA subunit